MSFFNFLKPKIPTTFYRVSIKALIWDDAHEKFLITLEDNGKWELPGGGLDWPEKPEEGMKRELMEEMGLTMTWMNMKPSHVLIGKNMKGKQSLNLVYEVKVKDLNFTPSNECLEIKFVTPEEALKLNLFRNVAELAEEMINSKK